MADERAVIGTSQATTWEIDDPCRRLGWDDGADDQPCRIAELDHYGQPTGELFCYTHMQVVGTVRTCNPT